MTKFNYTKWVTDYKNGKPLFEQATGSYTGSATGSGTGSATGSGTGSGGPSTGGNTPTGSGQICANFIATSCTGTNNQWNGYCKTVDGSTPVVGQIIPNASGDYHTIHTVNPPFPNQSQGADYTSVSSCTGNTTGSYGSGSCNPSSWSNYSNWINNILPNNGAFSSSNPNQPCQFLCNRISAITNQIPTVGPNWANQLECKIEEFQNQSQVNNCSC